ncbi:hypothetical protein CWI36_3374p0010, partial [Hamiltosporidium magnivora]
QYGNTPLNIDTINNTPLPLKHTNNNINIYSPGYPLMSLPVITVQHVQLLYNKEIENTFYILKIQSGNINWYLRKSIHQLREIYNFPLFKTSDNIEKRLMRNKNIVSILNNSNNYYEYGKNKNNYYEYGKNMNINKNNNMNSDINKNKDLNIDINKNMYENENMNNDLNNNKYDNNINTINTINTNNTNNTINNRNTINKYLFPSFYLSDVISKYEIYMSFLVVKIRNKFYVFEPKILKNILLFVWECSVVRAVSLENRVYSESGNEIVIENGNENIYVYTQTYEEKEWWMRRIEGIKRSIGGGR